jgi:predicted O-methyltransferase YrrM
MRFRGLEGVLDPGPAFVLDGILSSEECGQLIDACENDLGFGHYYAGKNHHGALQIVVGEDLANALGARLAPYVDVRQVDRLRRETQSRTRNDSVDKVCGERDETRLVYRGLNRRWRFYRYAPGGVENFAPHIDAGFPASGLSDDGSELVWDCTVGVVDGEGVQEVVSRLTVLFYLNEDFEGGRTNFFEPVAHSHLRVPGVSEREIIASIRPVAGSCLVFPQAVGEDAVAYAREHWPLHEGSPVTAQSSQPKYVIRSDILFATVRESRPPPEDPLFRYDAVVRQTFLPSSSVLNANFLSHVESLYNPHMGVENLGPFLYSFVRFTKVRSLVEVGAGYTTLWILQALRDNEEEMLRIRELEADGRCRLLDWPWTNQDQLRRYFSQGTSQLLCVDNCEHQKETASGASSVARALGLSQHLRFLRGDAFELELQPESVDVVWCDFGVGSRMRDFCASVWDSVRPGGFLLCHSSLTNQRTREWLEAARAHRGIAETGLPSGDYVELSLLEPHKHYQNSISIFQKRRDYTEPIYSEFA